MFREEREKGGGALLHTNSICVSESISNDTEARHIRALRHGNVFFSAEIKTLPRKKLCLLDVFLSQVEIVTDCARRVIKFIIP